ncbi:FkbM family methyltransferase [Thermoleptolyngbya sp.]
MLKNLKAMLRRTEFVQKASQRALAEFVSAPAPAVSQAVPNQTFPAQQLVANKKDRVISLLASGVPINAVVDVGVQRGTWELMEALRDKHHHLFEPVSLWYADIERNYSSISNTLYPVALSNEVGSAWLVQTALLKDGVATHSRISEVPITPDEQEIVSCQEIKIDRLDSYSHLFERDYLLKVDVDGKDLEVLQGASGCISNASVVIVEAHWAALTARGKILEEYGFELIDIVDRVMYGQVLWQCDLVYLRNDLMNERLRPPMFDPAYWHPLP